MKVRTIVSMAVGAMLAALTVAPAAASSASVGAVYTLSNATAGNAVIAYARGVDGQLTPLGTFATGGLGSGAGLGSQGAVTLSDNGRWLLAVDAGSDEITSFAVGGDHRLAVADRVASGGAHPISVTIEGGLVYVVNDGGSGGIAGFHIDGRGQLTAIAGSERPLTTDASQPAQISLTPDARHVVVTEKATNQITSYAIGANGAAGAPQAVTSAGETPFGFAFDKRGNLVVSEAYGGAPDASTVSSYAVTGAGAALIDGPVATTETAACWVVVTGNGKFAYAANTGSGTLSGYAIGHDGSLTLLDADGVTGMSGGSPADLSRSANSKFVYVRSGGSIVTFAVGHRGDLTNLGTTAVQAGIVGLASR